MHSYLFLLHFLGILHLLLRLCQVLHLLECRRLTVHQSHPSRHLRKRHRQLLVLCYWFHEVCFLVWTRLSAYHHRVRFAIRDPEAGFLLRHCDTLAGLIKLERFDTEGLASTARTRSVDS